MIFIEGKNKSAEEAKVLGHVLKVLMGGQGSLFLPHQGSSGHASVGGQLPLANLSSQ